MKEYSLSNRAELYNKAFPKYPPLAHTERWVYGIWMIGNDYRSKCNFYGEYPPSYLARLVSMFPDASLTLHLFSGSLGRLGYDNAISFDLVQEADVKGDAHQLSLYFDNNIDLIIADPPYSAEDAEHYGTPMVNRNKVVSECCKILLPGGFLCWLDTVLPMYRKVELQLVGTIGVIRSTNHRFRVLSIFRKQGAPESW